MKTLKNVKKVLAVAGAVGIGAMFLAGCSLTGYTTEDMNKASDDSYKAGVASVDITSDNTKAFDQGMASVVIPDITSDNDKAVEDAINTMIANGKLEVVVPEGTDFSEDGLNFGGSYNFVIKHKDLSRLAKNDITYDGEKYTIHEEIIVNPDVVYEDEKFEGVSALSFGEGDLEYKYVFDDMPTIVEDEALKINLLGKEISITEWDGDTVTAKTGVDMTLGAGDTYLAESKTVLIKAIGEGSVIVSVDGETEIISEGDTKEVNDVEIFVEEVFYDDLKSERLAWITVGKDVTSTIEDGEPAELFGFDEDNDAWLYKVTENSIGIVNNQKYTHHETDDDNFGVLYEGQKLATLIGDISYNLEDAYKYFDVKFYEGNVDDIEGIMISGDFEYDSDVYSKVFCGENLQVKKDGEWIVTESAVTVDGTDVELGISEGYCGVGNVYTNLEKVYIGDEEVTDVDSSKVTQEGIKVLDIEDNIDNKELVTSVPEEPAKGEIAVA